MQTMKHKQCLQANVLLEYISGFLFAKRNVSTGTRNWLCAKTEYLMQLVARQIDHESRLRMNQQKTANYPRTCQYFFHCTHDIVGMRVFLELKAPQKVSPCYTARFVQCQVTNMTAMACTCTDARCVTFLHPASDCIFNTSLYIPSLTP